MPTDPRSAPTRRTQATAGRLVGWFRDWWLVVVLWVIIVIEVVRV